MNRKAKDATFAEETGVSVLEKQPFPTPAVAWCRNQKDFFDYVTVLPEQFAKRGSIYVYRGWPVVDKRICPKCATYCEKTARAPRADCLCPQCGWKGQLPTYAGIITEPFGALDPGWFLHSEHYGSGDYTLKLVDCDGSKNSNGICSTRISLRDEDFPPCITDLREIVQSDPANEKYLKGLRGRGILLPGDTQPVSIQSVVEKEEEMANTEAVTTMAGAMERMADKNIELARETIQAARAIQSTPAPAATPSQDGDSPARGFEAGVKLAETMARTMSGNGDKSGPTSVDLVDRIIAVAERLAPKPVDMTSFTTLVSDLRKQVSDSDDRAWKAIEARVSAAEARAAVPPVVPVSSAAPEKSVRERVHEIVGLQEDMEQLGLAGAKDGGSSWMDKAMQNLPQLLALGSMLTGVFHNFVVLQTGRGAPQNPGMTQPGGGVTMAGQLTGDQVMARFFATFERPLLESVMDDQPGTGADFADLIIKIDGRAMYDSLRQVIISSPMSFIQFLQGNPQLWLKVKDVPQQRWMVFMQEFCSLDEIRAAEEKEAEERGARKKVVRKAAVATAVDGAAVEAKPTA
jgi:hypothetical protein